MVKGLGPLLKKLTLYQKKYLIAEKKGLKLLGQYVASDARKIINIKGAVDSGTLKGSIHPSPPEVRGTTFGKIVIVPVGTNVHYAPYVEFGTRYMYPRSFLFEALKKWSGKKGRDVLAAYTRLVK